MNIKDLLDFLDGRGIVFEDEDLVIETLHEHSIAIFDELIICSPKIGSIWSGTTAYEELVVNRKELAW